MKESKVIFSLIPKIHGQKIFPNKLTDCRKTGWKKRMDNLPFLKTRENICQQPWHIRPDGRASKKPEAGTIPAWFLQAPFAFCPECLVSYNPRLSDFTKLATLGTEGRSTATTILSMSTVNHLREEQDLQEIARKFLCFSDNRQDASLQSGHFNDFVEIGLIRSALYNALEHAGPAGLEYDKLPERVFEALGLGYPDKKFPKENYSVVPDAKFNRAKQVDKAFRSVLEYRIYSDLRRGWRIVAPNLEQSGLLEIEYLSLDDVCDDDEIWRKSGLLYTSSPEKRKKNCACVLDFLRSRLAIKADPLDQIKQEEIARQSRQQLIDPWLIEDDENLHVSTVAYPRPRKADDNSKDIFLTPRSNFGMWLKSRQAFPSASSDEIVEVINGLVSALQDGGLLEVVSRKKDDDPGFQLSASTMLWKAGDGKKARHDRFRVRHANGEFGRTNPFLLKCIKTLLKMAINSIHASTRPKLQANFGNNGKKNSVKQNFPSFTVHPPWSLESTFHNLMLLECAMCLPLQPIMPKGAVAPEDQASLH